MRTFCNLNHQVLRWTIKIELHRLLCDWIAEKSDPFGLQWSVSSTIRHSCGIYTHIVLPPTRWVIAEGVVLFSAFWLRCTGRDLTYNSKELTWWWRHVILLHFEILYSKLLRHYQLFWGQFIQGFVPISRRWNWSPKINRGAHNLA